MDYDRHHKLVCRQKVISGKFSNNSVLIVQWQISKQCADMMMVDLLYSLFSISKCMIISSMIIYWLYKNYDQQILPIDKILLLTHYTLASRKSSQMFNVGGKNYPQSSNFILIQTAENPPKIWKCIHMIQNSNDKKEKKRKIRVVMSLL